MIRVALAGAGVMGANHARLLSSIPECELVAVVEQDDVRGQAVAAMAGTKHLTSFDELPDDVQAVVIATPTATHEKLGIQLLGRGIDLLIEKPIASNAVEARRLLEAVEGTDQILMVGHIERFNPAFIELQRFLDEPLHLEFTRVGPYSPRVGIDVVLDLMIHDLDLALTMADSQVASMSATGRVIMGDTLDLASALLVFESGLTATLTAMQGTKSLGIFSGSAIAMFAGRDQFALADQYDDAAKRAAGDLIRRMTETHLIQTQS